jgi:hypothetical protein
MAQIMAVTGHKPASSVAVYQRVSTKEKQVMGDIITSSVRGEQLDRDQLWVSNDAAPNEYQVLRYGRL